MVNRSWLLPVLLSLLAACTTASARRVSDAAVAATGGDPARGRQTLSSFGCGACHAIPGVRGARGTLAPPLTRFSQRSFIAGHLPNNAENLVNWIMHPQALAPATAMPDLGAPEQSARDMAAYLYTLR